MTDKKNVLFLSVPNVSLLAKRTNNIINSGSIAVAGGLEFSGFNVDQYDLNAKLNTYRKKINNFELCDDDYNVLLNIDKLKDFLVIDEHSESYLPHLTNWLLQDIDVNSYDIIAMSMVTPLSSELWAVTSTLHFTIILTSFIRENYNVDKIYVGGHQTLKWLTGEYQDRIFNEIDDKHCPTSFILKFAENSFGDFLNSETQQRVVTLQKDITLQYKNYSKPEFKNNSEVLTTPNEFMPEKLLEKYSKLKTVEPFQLYPYKFTVGCKFKCTFCQMAPLLDFITLSPSNTVDHLEEMADRGVKHFKFFNDQINFKKVWLMEFCNEIIKRNLKITWSDSANLRLGNKEIYDTIKEAGCIKLWYGTESINDDILKVIRKNVTVDRIKENLQLAHDAGIFNSCNFIINFPHETDEQFWELVNFIKEYAMEKKIINGYKINIFMLGPETVYQTNPDKMGIELIQDGKFEGEIHYNEKNGKTWKEIVQAGIEKREIMESGLLYSVDQKEIRMNDFVLVALHKAKYTTNEIFQFYNDIENILSEEEQYQWVKGNCWDGWDILTEESQEKIHKYNVQNERNPFFK